MPHPWGETDCRNHLEAEARQFHLAYPEVWRLVCQEAQRAIDRGFKKYEINLIWATIRHYRLLDIGPEQEFKMPHNHRAYYARWFNTMMMSGDKFFDISRLRSSEGGSYDRFGRPIDVDDDDDPDSEPPFASFTP